MIKTVGPSTKIKGWIAYRCDRCEAIIDSPYTANRVTCGCKPPEPAPAVGPGTELTNILYDAGAKSDVCGGLCAQWRDRMNVWSIDGCREHRQEIIDHLTAVAYKTWITDQIKIGWAISRQPWFKVSDPVGCIVDRAIEMAKSATAYPQPSAIM